MKQAVLKHWDLPWLPVSALIIFVICFVLYALWTYSKENKKMYEDASYLPLQDPSLKGNKYE